MTTRRFGPYTVELSREEKVLFPDSGISKGDLVRYYEELADHLLPHLRHRPLTLHRFPDGIDEDGFFQKNRPDYFPDWIGSVAVPLADGGRQEQIVATNAATLVYLADQGCITPHPWLSRTDALKKPDRMIFDLDPSDGGFVPVKEAARLLRELLTDVGLEPFFMTTGSTGGHVWVPIRRGPGFDEVRVFAGEVAECLANVRFGDFTVEARTRKRRGRLYLDAGRNALGQTATSPYAVRPNPGAPVATPLDWEEVEQVGLESTSYDLRSVPRRIARRGDPWKGMGRHARDLGSARSRFRQTYGEDSHA